MCGGVGIAPLSVVAQKGYKITRGCTGEKGRVG